MQESARKKQFDLELIHSQQSLVDIPEETGKFSQQSFEQVKITPASTI
jgi:hypothetical protein